MKNRTRKHSSRMRTVRLETVHASVSVTNTRCHSVRGPQMDKLEQVSSDHHQMSPVGCPKSDVQGAGGGRGSDYG